MTPEQLKKEEVELIVSLVGVDETSMQPVHARKRYLDHEIVFGARHADMVSIAADGRRLVVDVTKFHDTVPTKPTPTFPYPAPADAANAAAANDAASSAPNVAGAG